ncbi:recombinase family protein [candidate division KSB1 bacterium]
MKQVYGYLRVSSKGQIEKDGFARQKKAIQNYAKKHKVDIASFFEEEGISGTLDIDNRPAFQAMMNAIMKNGVNAVIVERLDRLAREYRIQEQLLIYMASKGIELISAETEENITEAIKADPMRLAMVQMQGIFSQLEKNLLVKKLRLSRERIRATGRKVEGRKSYTEIAPEVIESIKKLRKKPRGKKRMSYADIADALNKNYLMTVSGKPFTKNNVAVIIHRLV